MNPNTAHTLATFLDGLVADARAELRLPPLPPVIPPLASILAAARSRARAELADDASEIDRDFIAGVRKWETIELAKQLAAISEPMRESMIWIMALADDPLRSWQLDLSPAWVKVENTNHTPGPSTKYVGYSPIPDLSIGTQSTYFYKPPIPDGLRCTSRSAWGNTSLPDGSGKVIRMPCGKCDNCREWRRQLIARRYGLGKRGPLVKDAPVNQTLVRVSGFASDDYTLPVEYAESLRRRVSGKRLRLLRRGDDYMPELVIVFDSELDSHTIGLIERDINRKELRGSVVVGPITSAMVFALIDSEPTRPGTRRKAEYRRPTDPDTINRDTAHFAGWPDYEQPEHDYVYGDIDVIVDDPSPPDAAPITSLEKHLKRLPVAERSIEAVQMRMQGQTVNRGLFDAVVKAVENGDGPALAELWNAIYQTTAAVVSRQLLTDVAKWAANPAGIHWRDCWQPVTDALGIESPDPTCLQCERQTPAVTLLHLCGRCELARGA